MRSPRRSLLTAPALAVIMVVLCVPAAWAEKTPAPTAPKDKVGVEEQLGVTLPAGLVFKDEAGSTVDLAKLIQRPTVLTLVYYRCPGICSPLLRELTRTIDELENVRPGEHYDLITVSFDPSEGPELAKINKTNYLGRMETKVPPESWHWLTGEEAMIRRLTDLVGFYYKRTEDGADFLHTGTAVFLTKEGKIVRYLTIRDNDGDHEMDLLPFDMEMAVNDATAGRERTFMQKIQQLCYRQSPDGKGYVLDVTQIVLWATLIFAGVFFAFVLLFKRKKSSKTNSPDDPSLAGQATEGGAV